jgi:hypothetical protein
VYQWRQRRTNKFSIYTVNLSYNYERFRVIYIPLYYEFSLLHIFSLVIFFVHATVLSLKTAFDLVKIHLLFRIMILIQ